MKSIAFIIPYFGKFNNYFNLWLNSCANNPSVDWLIFTDCTDKYEYPNNVKIEYITFDKLREYIQSLYDFRISLETPYKLCDFRPAYGDIFYKYIKDYDFWGYCDTDLIWGDLREFFTEEILSKYEKIGIWGHCCLIRNSEKMRVTYKYEDKNYVTYKEAFSSDLSFCFDEAFAFGRYCKESGISIFNNYTFFDIDYRHDDYRISKLDQDYIQKFNVQAHNVFEYNHGKLFLLSVNVGSNTILRKEISYVHFQKRKMNINIQKEEYQLFLVYGDTFDHYQNILNAELVKEMDRKSWKRKIFYDVLWRKIKAEYLHFDGVRYYKYK